MLLDTRSTGPIDVRMHPFDDLCGPTLVLHTVLPNLSCPGSRYGIGHCHAVRNTRSLCLKIILCD